MTITAIVEDVVEETIYQGQTYEYRVILAYNGVQFGVFDKDMLSSPEYVGSRCEVEIVPFMLTEVSKVENSSVGIIPNENNPHDWKYHTYMGRVLSITTEEPRTVTLDLGGGTIDAEIDVDQETEGIVDSLDEGNLIRITSTRTDLHGISITLL